MTLPIDLIRFLRGPYYALASEVGTLLEGEGCEAGIIQPDGTCFEMLWLGGHDGSNKLVGGGFQTTSGQPQFAAPVGAALLDPATCTIWVSTSYAGSGISGAYSGNGQWCPISEAGASGGGVEEIDTEAPILGGPITAGQTGTIRHALSGVSPGTYTRLTVDEWGHVTNGDNGGGGVFTGVYTNQQPSTTMSGGILVFDANWPPGVMVNMGYAFDDTTVASAGFWLRIQNNSTAAILLKGQNGNVPTIDGASSFNLAAGKGIILFFQGLSPSGGQEYVSFRGGA